MTDVLKTNRLTLRPLQITDAPDVAAQINDLDVSRWLTSVPYPYTINHAQEFLSRAGKGHWAILGASGFMGVVTIAKQLGYWLGKPFWGQGVMTEAARACVDAHFSEGAGELTSGYLVGNGASARILTKLGFEHTHIIESFVSSRGCRAANQQMRLARGTWEAGSCRT